MPLKRFSGDCDGAIIPKALGDCPLTDEEATLSPQEKRTLALELVYGDVYRDYKAKIMENTATCTRERVAQADATRMKSTRRMNVILTVQTVLMQVT